MMSTTTLMPRLDFTTIQPNALVTVTAPFVSKRVERDGTTQCTVVRLEDETGATAPVLFPPPANQTIIDVRVGKPIRLSHLVVHNASATMVSRRCPRCEQSFLRTEAVPALDDGAVDVLGAELQKGPVCFVARPTTRYDSSPAQTSSRLIIECEVSSKCPRCEWTT
jgi:phage FluMu protein Com